MTKNKSKKKDKVPLPLTFDRTGRGFQFIRFNDYYGAECSVQQSSLALTTAPGEGALWIGVDKGQNGVIVNQRMHLTYEQVPVLIEVLQAWLDDGNFEKYER